LSADSVTQIRHPAGPPRLPEQSQRAGGESIHQLSERMRPVVAIAVDADEVAAVLEASGINDRVARTEYDVTSVFSLASLLLKSGSRTECGATFGTVAPTELLPQPEATTARAIASRLATADLRATSCRSA
jgi:hypothetical protein